MVTTIAPMSSGWTMMALRSSGTGVGRFSRMGVLTSPGWMVVTRTPFGASSLPTAVLYAAMANFEAQ